MSPVEINERTDPVGVDADESSRRASKKGFLSIPLRQSIELLDWTGRQIRAGSSGSIPTHLAPILTRIGLNRGGWCDVVKKLGKLFKRAAGTLQSMADDSAWRGQGCMQSPGSTMFAT